MNEIEKIASKMTQEQLINALAVMSKNANNSFKRKQSTSKTEISAGLVSRAKGTTLVAKSWKATESFNRDIEHIKIILKYIW